MSKPVAIITGASSGIGQAVAAAMIDRFAAPPETVAQTVLQAIRNNRAVLFPTWSAWFLHFADRWLPPLSALGNVRYRDQVLELAERESAEGRPVS